jgi:hypothetical protein
MIDLFIDRPTRAVAPERLAALLGHGLSSEAVARIQSSRRGRDALDRLLVGRFGSLPALDPVQQHVARLDGDRLTMLSFDLGAIWHARAIASIVAGDQVRALVETIGAERRLLAFRARDDAPDVGNEHAATPASLAVAVPRDGMACLSAWCDLQPVAFATRLRLRLPDEPIPDKLHRTYGPTILLQLVQGLIQ